jgi:hypothetical protein
MEAGAKHAEASCGARNEIAATATAVGAFGEFPIQKPSLLGEAESTIKNIPELIDWSVLQLDGLMGQWPNTITTLDRDGIEKTSVVEDLAQWCRESFALGKVIAEDAQQSIEVGSRIAVQCVSTAIAASQAVDIARANAKFLGYAGEDVERKIKIPFSVPALGKDGKLQNQETEQFLTDSVQEYVSWENRESKDLLSLSLVITEATQLVKAAHFFPADKLPGDILRAKKAKPDKGFLSAIEALKKDGHSVKTKKRIP